MTIEYVNPPQLAKPSGFTHAVRADSHVYLSGQTAMLPDGTIVAGGITAQFRQAFGNLLASLAEAGGKPSDLVAVTIYLIDIDDYQANGREIGTIWREMAGTTYPAMTGVGVTGLWQKDALIEIQGVAAIQAT